MTSIYVFTSNFKIPPTNKLGRIIDQQTLALPNKRWWFRYRGEIFNGKLHFLCSVWRRDLLLIPWWLIYHQMMANVMACWSTTLPILVVRWLLELDIKPKMLFKWPICGDIIIACKVKSLHAGPPSCVVWLLWVSRREDKASNVCYMTCCGDININVRCDAIAVNRVNSVYDGIRSCEVVLLWGDKAINVIHAT